MEMKSKTCRILIITDTYVGVPGGSERHLFNFLSNLSSNFHAKVIQLNPTGNPYLKEAKKLKDNVELASFPLVNFKSFRSIRCIGWVYKEVLTFKPDIVISYHEMADLLNIIISTFPQSNYKIISSKRDMGLNLNGRLGYLMKSLNKRFSAITAPSKSIIDLVNSEFSGKIETTHVIPNGLKLSEYGREILDRDGIKLKLGLPINKKIIITIGWLRPGKGHEFLLKAFSQLKNMNEYCLVLLGNGSDQDRLQAMAEEYGISNNTIFAGVQKNVNEWLSVSDVAVSSSLSEGLSNALVEAAASQLPIIATNVGGNPEVVDDGINGYLVKSECADSMLSALSSLFENENNLMEMGQRSRLKAENEFSVEKMVSSLEALYLKTRDAYE